MPAQHQPPVQANVYAQPYGIVPDFHPSHNFSPFGTQKNVRIRGYPGQPNRYSVSYKTEKDCAAVVKDPKSLPGLYPRDAVPAEKKKYLRESSAPTTVLWVV
ncbi:hypothetical protein [uncultured Lawsonella sp.]|uniref:hypothetical protein n=1 Tax=uncultured Lawsonella sp. TaxID=1847727 RepID=UPI00261EB46C|nr:hypothetical protein [uncultured Lawsonella sp.]